MMLTLNSQKPCYDLWKKPVGLHLHLSINCFIFLLTGSVESMPRSGSRGGLSQSEAGGYRTAPAASRRGDADPRAYVPHRSSEERILNDISGASSLTSLRTGEINIDDMMSPRPRPAPRRRGLCSCCVV